LDIRQRKKNASIPKVSVLGVKVDDISKKNAVDAIVKMAKDKKGGHYVVTINSEFVMKAKNDPDFYKILKNADLALADGAGVVVSKLIFGGKIHERITGVDLIKTLCEEAAKNAITVGFLGGFGSVADEVSKRQKKAKNSLRIKLAESGEPTIGYDLRLKKRFSELGRVDILFVAYGMGLQEFWIERNLKNLDVGVFIGVGGAFDMISGVKKRAPKFMQNTGLEWLWRLLIEPKRLWRMRVLPSFLAFVLKDRLLKIVSN
jgi:N-acetylglucosaminyldiphosphoundecaprenol N-acetyl-beta-D-mannosaminyltransferase